MTRQDVRTIAYYDRNAPAFVTDTVGVSMGAALTAFVELLPAGARVLDWGCGGGRDSRALRRLGFDVTSVDASAAMAEEALAATGTIVRVESFGELDEVDAYDGIWACASLLHVRPEELPDVLASAARAGGEGRSLLLVQVRRLSRLPWRSLVHGPGRRHAFRFARAMLRRRAHVGIA